MTKAPPNTSQDRIRALPCWHGGIEIAPLGGGLSNENFLVTDTSGKHVVRIGRDYPFHHVFRDRQMMTARAAHDAGFGPAVEYAEPGVSVGAFIVGRTFTGADVRSNVGRVAQLIISTRPASTTWPTPPKTWCGSRPRWITTGPDTG